MKKNQIGFGALIKPVRFVLCGVLNGASIFDIIMIFGKEKTIVRFKNFLLKNKHIEKSE